VSLSLSAELNIELIGGDVGLEEPTPSKPPRLGSSKVDHSLTLTSDLDLTIRAQPRPTSTANPNTSRAGGKTPAGDMTFMTDKSFGVNRAKLVQHLTDVYGSEPWWEGLASLDLRERGVESLDGLEEYLPDLEEVYLYVHLFFSQLLGGAR
jgi:hypothetical protein